MWNNEHKTPYVHYPSSTGREWMGYDDIESLGIKVNKSQYLRHMFRHHNCPPPLKNIIFCDDIFLRCLDLFLYKSGGFVTKCIIVYLYLMFRLESISLLYDNPEKNNLSLIEKYKH